MKNYFLLLFTVVLLGLYSCESYTEEETFETTTEENIDLRGPLILGSVTVGDCCHKKTVADRSSQQDRIKGDIPSITNIKFNTRRVTIELDPVTHSFYNVNHGGPLTYTFSNGISSFSRTSASANPSFCLSGCKIYTLIISSGSSQSPLYSFKAACCYG